MRNGTEDFLAFVTHLHTEHRRLRKAIAEIEEQWGKCRSTRPTALVPVRQKMEQLRSELADHFAEEEAGACLEEAVSRQPSLGPEANRLEREHPVLLSQLDGLISRLRGMVNAGPISPDVRMEFETLTNRLRAHESAERGILEQSFSRPSE